MYYFLTQGRLTKTTDPKIIENYAHGEYVALDPKNVVRHIKDGQIIEAKQLNIPTVDSPVDLKKYGDAKELVRETQSQKVAEKMFGLAMRKRKSGKKLKRNMKKCKCR
jgi:hypothetical protein